VALKARSPIVVLKSDVPAAFPQASLTGTVTGTITWLG